MPKMKTHKGAIKRLRVTGARKGKKKVIHRYASQNHFNAREGGKVMRNKRRDKNVSSTHKANVSIMLPNHNV